LDKEKQSRACEKGEGKNTQHGNLKRRQGPYSSR